IVARPAERTRSFTAISVRRTVPASCPRRRTRFSGRTPPTSCSIAATRAASVPPVLPAGEAEVLGPPPADLLQHRRHARGVRLRVSQRRVGRLALVVAHHHGEAIHLRRGGGGHQRHRERGQRLTKLHRVTWQPSGTESLPRSSWMRSGSSSMGEEQNTPTLRSLPRVWSSRVPSGSGISVPAWTGSARAPTV